MDAKKIGVGFGVMVLREGKILLGQRHPDPEKAGSIFHGEGTWTMPGGKLHFGESFEEGAAREILEETGLAIEQDKLKLIAVNNDRITDAHFITMGLLYEGEVAEPKVMEPDEITKWDWFALDSLPQPLYPLSQKVVDNYLQGKFYIK
jgi:8-oxo-dGTP diphosphatase